MSLKTAIQRWLGVGQQDNFEAMMKQQQALFQQLAASMATKQTPPAAVSVPTQPGTSEADGLKQQITELKAQIFSLQSQLADAKAQGVKDFFAQAEAEHKDLQERGKGRPSEEGTKSLIRIEPDVRERVALLSKISPGTNLTKFLNAAAREKLKDIFSDPEYQKLLFSED